MNFLKNFGIQGKMISITSMGALAAIIVGASNVVMFDSVVATYKRVTDDVVPNMLALSSMRGAARSMGYEIMSLGVTNVSGPAVKEALENIETQRANYIAGDKKYVELPFGPGEKELYEKIKPSCDEVMKNVDKVLVMQKSTDSSVRAQISAFVSGEADASVDSCVANITAALKFQQDANVDAGKDATDHVQKAHFVGLFLLIFGAISTFLVGFFYSRSIARSMLGLATDLNHGAAEVASASVQISESSTQLSSSATEQAAALQETVASIDEVSAMVRKNADNAQRSLQVSSASQTAADQGKASVDEMVRAIEDINRSNAEIMNQIESSNRQIGEIVKVISEIGNKTKVINDIVFQTKLLSFNASVEAARAGEHGKGFAVVAEEVGNLAEMSGNAAKEISQMLDGSIQKVEGIVNETRTKVDRLVGSGKAKIEAGTEVAKRCGRALDEIVKNVSELNQMVSEISTASTEQSQGVEEINKAMAQMDQVTQQNASASQQSAAAGHKLSNQATELKQSVQSLLRTVSGGSGQVANTDAPTSPEITAAPGQVLEFKKKKNLAPTADSMPQVTLKKAVGAENPPSENDPRFEDL